MSDIILLHGAIGAADQLEALAATLTKLGYRTHLLNFSGHGKTPFQIDFGIEAFALELETFVKEKNLQQPAVFGYSMGGYIALLLAFKKPELLGNIITLGTKFHWSPEIAAKEIKMLDSKTILEKVPKFAEALKGRHGAEWENLLAKTAQMMTGLGNSNVLQPDYFSVIENKVLIGLADKDTMVSLDETTAVYKLLKNGSMYMLPETKHPIETVNAELLATVIKNFIKA